MQNELYKNNKATISGRIISEFRFIREIHGKKLYRTYVEIPRLSGQMDILPVMVSDALISPDIGYPEVTITGQYISYNSKDNDGKNHLILNVYARKIRVKSEPLHNEQNEIFLDGYICKQPIYRKTPLGREITDFLLAVNGPNRSDYIPCISWGRNSHIVSGFTVGTRVCIWGRIQSREYMKNLSSGNSDLRVAYEVSVSQLELIEEGR